MTTLAGHTFLSTLATEWITFDTNLASMDTFGRAAEWAIVNESYHSAIPSAGMSLAEMVEMPNLTHDFSGEEALPLLYAYYGPEAADFVADATWGTDFAAGWDDVSRREMLTKGVAYRNVLYQVFHRLALGLSSCAAGTTPAGETAAPGVYEWETAGQLELKVPSTLCMLRPPVSWVRGAGRSSLSPEPRPSSFGKIAAAWGAVEPWR